MTQQLIEPLEARIAPAVIVNPIFDITAAPGQSGVSIDIAKLVDATKTYRTFVELVTNFTPDGETSPAVIRIEMFDDKAPETVANFLRYINNPDRKADYDGTFFHRLVTGFVLQGGGFNVDDRTNHITTFPTLHNEFDATDPERSNLVQTVAMAKVATESGGGPHSATSEFFINLDDNSGNLNAQNGGFTVFGRVTDDSMAFVNAIAGLELAFGAFPVQNYEGGTPSNDEVIQIVDARVAAPTFGNAAGHTFTVEVTDENGQPTTLVTPSFSSASNQLSLAFSKTLNGIAKVKVTVDGGVEMDEFTVTVKPNLIADVTSDGLSSSFVPGDKGTAKVKLTNTSGGLAKGAVNVKLYLSDFDNPNDESGFIFDPASDVFLGSVNGIAVNIASGKTGTVSVPFTVPAAGLINEGNYRVLAVIETPAGSTIQELHTDDNVGNFTLPNVSLTDSDVLRNFNVAFGVVGTRTKVLLTVQDFDGEDVTFSLLGPGRGSVTKNVDGTVDVTLVGTTTASTLLVKTAKGVIADLDDIFINDIIGSVKLGNVHLHGHFTASDGAKSIVIGDLGNTDDAHPENNADKTLSIGSLPLVGQKLKVTLGNVRDYTFYSDTPVSVFSAKSWLNAEANTAPNSITLPSVTVFKITGDLEAGLSVSGDAKTPLISVGGTFRDATLRGAGDFAVIKLGAISGGTILAGLSAVPVTQADFDLAKNITTLIVKGAVTGATLAAATFKSINVGGAFTDSTLRTSGDIGIVTLGALTGSTILAGLDATPDARADFETAAAIGVFNVRGAVADSIIAAATFRSIVIGSVSGTTGEPPSGFFADAIKSYLRKGPVVKKLVNLDDTNLTDATPRTEDILPPNYSLTIY